MNEEIKENLKYCYEDSYISEEEYKRQIDYITNLQQENEKLKEQNNDLRKIYRNTYKRLFKNGNDELARYFQAQIDDCPTFYVDPIIDYAKEYKIFKSRCEKLENFIITLISELKHCELNGTKKLDIVSDYIKQKYDKLLNGVDENE